MEPGVPGFGTASMLERWKMPPRVPNPEKRFFGGVICSVELLDSLIMLEADVGGIPVGLALSPPAIAPRPEPKRECLRSD